MKRSFLMDLRFIAHIRLLVQLRLQIAVQGI